MYKDSQDRIDAYLRGEMTPGQRKQFEEDIRQDDKLREEYFETKTIAAALADRKKKLEQMARWDAEDAARKRIRRRKKQIRSWAIGISAAACIAVGFFVSQDIVFTVIAPDNGFVMPEFNNEAVCRGGDSGLEILDSMITREDYASALVRADSLIASCKDDMLVYENKDSLSEEDSYRKLQYGYNLYNLEWRRINLLLVLGKTEEAKTTLLDFSSKTGAYKAQADSLLRIINQ